MSQLPIKDSGKRQSFATGAVRDTQEGKPRYDLIPVHALSRLSQIYAQGRIKYPPEQKPGERVPVENWRRGIDTQRFMSSLLRHAYAYLEGNRDEDHMAQLVFNALGIIETEEMVYRRILPPSLLTLPDWTKPGGNLQAPQVQPEEKPPVQLPDDKPKLPPHFYDGRWQARRDNGSPHWEIRGGQVWFWSDDEARVAHVPLTLARSRIASGDWARCNEEGELLDKEVPEDRLPDDSFERDKSLARLELHLDGTDSLQCTECKSRVYDGDGGRHLGDRCPHCDEIDLDKCGTIDGVTPLPPLQEDK